MDRFSQLPEHLQEYILDFSHPRRTKIALNCSYGGFRPSKEVRDCVPGYTRNIERDNPSLIKAIEDVGKNGEIINGKHSDIYIDECLPKYARRFDHDESYWKIDEYDGDEDLIILEDKYELNELIKFKNKITELVKSDLTDIELGARIRFISKTLLN